MNIGCVIPYFKCKLSKAELLGLKHNLEKLIELDVLFICPKKFDGKGPVELQYLLNEKRRIEYFEDKYFESIEGYNELMLSKDFYRKFINFSHLLIVQLDALVFDVDFSAFQDFSYVGAPWKTSIIDGSKFSTVGNGGFSLRKTADHHKTFNKVKWILNFWRLSRFINKKKFVEGLLNRSKGSFLYFERLDFFSLNEDVIWSQFAPIVSSKFRVPAEEIAAEFSLETSPSYFFDKYLNGNMPKGCHAWEKYEPLFWQKHLPKSFFNY